MKRTQNLSLLLIPSAHPWALWAAADWSREALHAHECCESLSEHRCFLTKHVLTLSFDGQNCFAQCLTLTICDLKPCEVKRIGSITIKASVKRRAFKKYTKSSRKSWIISYQRKSGGLNPLDFTMSHCVPAMRWLGEGEDRPQNHGFEFKMINRRVQPFCESLLEMTHSSALTLQPVS